MTVKEIFETKIPEGLKERAEKANKINSVYAFCITGDDGGDWIVDLTKPDGGEVRAGKEEAQCTITVADSDFVDIVTGKLNGQMAFMAGKLKVAGDMGLAMKLQVILGG